MSRPVNALHVLEATEGGALRWLETVAVGLDAKRVRNCCVCSTRRGHAALEAVGRLRQRGVDVRLLDMRRAPHPVADAVAAARIASIIRNGAFDVIHAHSSKAGALARIGARMTTGAPVVYTPHAFAFLAGGVPAIAFRSFEKIARRWTGRLMAVSKSEREAAIGIGFKPEQISLIPNGVKLPATFRAPADAPRVVGSIGSLRKQKDPLAFIAACSIVRERQSDARFIVCGDGPLRQQCQALVADLGFGKATSFTGWRDDTRPVLDELDVFVSCARYEGMSYSVLDAMAAAKAVVATRVPGNEELICDGQTGLLAPPGNARAIADCILRLLDEPGLARRLGENARRVVEERYTLESQLAALTSFYEAVANGGPP